jgi:peptidoglycan/LPS O-acetylase OafA/YrhL
MDRIKFSSPSKYVKLRLEFLDGVRGFSALYVTAYHLLFWNLSLESIPLPIKLVPTVLRFGHSAVSIFIVLSGFSLMLGALSEPGQKLRGGFWGYISRRAKRILPPYYAAVAISLVFIYVEHQLFPAAKATAFESSFRGDAVFSHLLLVHNLSREWIGNINATHWSVATEWQIYFLLPLLFLPVYRQFGSFAMVLLGIICGVLPAFFSWGNEVYSACPWYIGTFTLGMLGAVWAKWMTENPQANHKSLIVSVFVSALVVTLVAFGIGGNGDLLERFSLPLAYAIQSGKDNGIGGLVLSFLLYVNYVQVTGQGSIWGKRTLLFLSGKKVKFFATFSYSLYLTHMIIVSGWSLIVEPYLPVDDTLRWLVRAFVALPIAISFGYIFYLFFEAPTMGTRSRVQAGTVK